MKKSNEYFSDDIVSPNGIIACVHDGKICEFDDTDTYVPASDLKSFGIPPYEHPAASMYGVGYGSLVAVNCSREQLAYWDESKSQWIDTPSTHS